MKSSGDDAKHLIDATRHSARGAEEAVHLAEKNAQRQLRAYVSLQRADVILNENEAKLLVSTIFKNSGQTPAYQFDPDVHLYYGKESEFVFLPPESDRSDVKITLSSNATIPQVIQFNVASDQVPIIKDKGNEVILYGTVQYRDIFGHAHICRFKSRRGQLTENTWAMHATADGNECD